MTTQIPSGMRDVWLLRRDPNVNVPSPYAYLEDTRGDDDYFPPGEIIAPTRRAPANSGHSRIRARIPESRQPINRRS